MMSTLGTFEPCWLLIQMLYGREEVLDQPQSFPDFWSGKELPHTFSYGLLSYSIHQPFPDMQVLSSVDGQQLLQP
jgi:hypothetical protein